MRITCSSGVLLFLLARWPEGGAFVPPPSQSSRPPSLLTIRSVPSSAQLPTNNSNELISLIEAHISDGDVELAEAELRNALKKGTARPSSQAFESIVLAWLDKSDEEDAATSRAEALLDEMELLHQPDGVIYRKLIDAWCSAAMREELKIESATGAGASSASGKVAAVDNLLEAVDRDIGEHQKRKEMSSTRSRAKHAAQHAGKILDRMGNLYLETRTDDLLPGVTQYKGVINAWKVLGSSCKEVDAAIRHINARRDAIFAAAEIGTEFSASKKAIASHKDILKIAMRLGDKNLSRRLVYRRFGRKVELDDDGTENIVDPGYRGVVTSTHNYNLIIAALAKSGRPWAGDQAEAILEYMVDNSAKNLYIAPNQISLNACIDAHAMSPKNDSARRAEALLDKLARWRRDYKLEIYPDCTSYNVVIKAWGLSRSADAVQNAERIFAKLEKDGRAVPDEICYSSLLNVYAKNSWRDSSAADKAENLLLKMHQEHQQSSKNIAPTVRCFNAALDAHARSRDKNAGRRALKLLSLMEDMRHTSGNGDFLPDSWSYNLVIKTLSKGGDRTSARQALELLERMEKWSKDGNERIAPDIITYNTCVDAFAKSRSKGSAETAERLYYRMKELRDGGDGGGVAPDAVTVASVIQSWALSGFDKSSARRAMELFEEAKKDPLIDLDTASYNAMLNCLSKSGSRQTLARALFRNAVSLSTVTLWTLIVLMKILSFFFFTMILLQNIFLPTYAFSLSNICSLEIHTMQPDRAEKLLEEMEAESAKGNARIRPDVISYTSTISALAMSNDRKAPYRAMKILAKMEAQAASGAESIRPNSMVSRLHLPFTL